MLTSRKPSGGRGREPPGTHSECRAGAMQSPNESRPRADPGPARGRVSLDPGASRPRARVIPGKCQLGRLILEVLQEANK